MDVDSRQGQAVKAPLTITGIVLCRNEDLHLAWSVRSIVGFCDRIILADHGSTDGTWAVAKTLAQEIPALEIHRIGHPRESHWLIRGLAGSNTWVFGVDGDEIYDPAGLARFRSRVAAGEFSDCWMVLGNSLNCMSFDSASGRATGYLAPPCRSVTKLYNFAAIDSWDGEDIKERLHGGNVRFRDGYHAGARLNLHEQVGWDEADLRCLHLCFLRRSSLEKPHAGPRENIMERYPTGVRGLLKRWLGMLLPQPRVSNWKRSRYMRGALVEKNIRSFLSSLS